MKKLRIVSCVLVCIMLIQTCISNASINIFSNENGLACKEAAINWLKDSQSEDGYWGEKIKLYETCEVLKYAENELGNDKRSEAVAWIREQQPTNNDDLFRVLNINEIENEKGTKNIEVQ